MSPALQKVLEGFRSTVALVERAKTEVVAAAPTGRGPGRPVAEALAAFEAFLAEARSTMPAWRSRPFDADWTACSRALDEAGRRAELLRLEGSPVGYEELYGVLGDLLEPLEAFGVARDRFGRRSFGPRD